MTVREVASDAQLMAGDGKAFAQLVVRYQRPIYGYLARRVGTPAAEDLLAEVWMAAFRGRGTFDARFDSARPWLFTIARNVLNAHWGKRPCGVHTTGDELSDPWPDVDDRLDAAEVSDSLRAAVRALPPPQREVLLLVAWEDLTPNEVAVLLDMPAATVRSYLYRARRSLSDHPHIVTASNDTKEA
jgi:RNA polymerase sigma factor (sigma-70 family)